MQLRDWVGCEDIKQENLYNINKLWVASNQVIDFDKLMNLLNGDETDSRILKSLTGRVYHLIYNKNIVFD